MDQLPRLALLGVGLLGGAIAERLHRSGYPLVVYNRTKRKTRSLAQQGVRVSTRPEEALAASDVVLLLLADGPAIQACLLSPACATAVGGKTVIQMGTIGSDESRALHREIERLGGSYLEAPVLGSLAEAKAGTLIVMVGTTEEQFARWSPLFRTLGREPKLIGPVGQAASLKLALNQLIAAEIAAFALSLGLVQRSGVSVDTFMEILRQSALFAPTFEKKLPRLLRRDYANPNFPTRHLSKDVALCLREAVEQGLGTEGLEGLLPLLERTIGQGLGEMDYSALYEAIDPARTGLTR